MIVPLKKTVNKIYFGKQTVTATARLQQTFTLNTHYSANTAVIHLTGTPKYELTSIKYM